jgi:rhodanese-related sulfurtransferase
MTPIVVTPMEVALRIAPDGNSTYIDVRTVAEFVQGRPRGRVINVPIEFYHPKTGAAHSNASFMLVIGHACQLNQPLIVGGDAGPRATTAADILIAAGYANVTVMTAGLPGWQAAGLSVTGNNADGVSYVSLLMPAKRKEGAPAAH